jgi:DHA3 family tetracycline resistance protein-like MFS transporter
MGLKRYERDAYKVYLFMNGAFALTLSVFFTVAAVYYATDITDDPFRLVLIGTAFQGTIILFEIPTGVVADVYSRRLSIWIGFVVLGIGTIIEGIFQIYTVVLVAEVISGIGLTFISGASDAWIADEIGEERVGQAYLRAAQVRQVMMLAGIPIGTALGTIALNIPVILSGVLVILLAVALVVVMPEDGFQRKPPEERESWRTMFKTFGEGVRLVRGRPVLIAILLISLVYGLSSAGFDNLWTVNMLDRIPFPALGHLKPVVWFGLINAIAEILGLVGTEIVRRKVDVRQQANIVRALMFFTGATALSMVVFGLSGSFWLSAGAYWVQLTLRAVSDPLFMTWINQNVESRVRATVLSMDAQANSLGQITGGPMIGAIGSTLSLPVALITTGLARIPVSLLFARLVLQGKRAQADTPLEPGVEV